MGRVRDFLKGPVYWYHYAFAFIAFCAGYWFLWSLGW